MSKKFYIIGAILFILAILYYFFPETIGILFMISAFLVFLGAPQQKKTLYWSINNKSFLIFLVLAIIGAAMVGYSGKVQDFKSSIHRQAYNMHNYPVLELIRDNAPDEDIIDAINSGADMNKSEGIKAEDQPLLLAIKNKRDKVLEIMIKKACNTKFGLEIQEPICNMALPELTEAAEYAIAFQNQFACKLLFNDSIIKTNPRILRLAIGFCSNNIGQHQRYPIEGLTKESMDTSLIILNMVLAFHPDLESAPDIKNDEYKTDPTFVFFKDKSVGNYQATFIYQHVPQLLDLFLKKGAKPDKKAIELLLKENQFYKFRKDIFNVYLASNQLDPSSKNKFQSIVSNLTKKEASGKEFNEIVKDSVQQCFYHFYHYPGSSYLPSVKNKELNVSLKFDTGKKLSEVKITNENGLSDFYSLEEELLKLKITSPTAALETILKLKVEVRSEY
jgi:hypothetical protein